jgi:hypothetical protein
LKFIFAECIKKHSANTFFAEYEEKTLGKEDSLPSVFYLALGKELLYQVKKNTRQTI